MADGNRSFAQRRPISQRGSSRAGRWAGALIFLVFFLVGAGLCYPLLFRPLREMIDSRAWPSTDCKVVSSQVGSHSDSDGTTYSIDIEYAYTVGGKEYRSKRYEPYGGSSSGYDGKKAVVDRHPAGAWFTCYYDPQDPSRALIKPGFSWKLLLGLFPLVFALIGLGGMGSTLRRPKISPLSKPAGNGPVMDRTDQTVSAPPSGDRVLEPVISSSAKLGCAAVGALVLTGILAVIYSDELRSGSITFWVLLNPFVLIDAVLIGVGLPYFYLATLNPKPILTLSPGSPRLGQDFTISWKFSGSVSRLERLTLTLVGTEEAQYRRGTDTVTDRSVFFQQVLKESTVRPEFGSGAVTARTPADNMHSWPLTDSPLAVLKDVLRDYRRFAEQAQQEKLKVSIHNRIVWKLELHGEIRMWPDVKESFEIMIYSAPPGAERSGRPLFEGIR